MRQGDNDPPTQPYPSRPDDEPSAVDAQVTSPRVVITSGSHAPDTLVTPPPYEQVRAKGSLPPSPVLSGAIVAEDATTMSGTYAFGEVLGRGGMGEVLLAHDRRIGRDVALKRLRSGAPGEEDIARFLREARIQARLDHPAIVPVYELARDHAGRPYFTMKRLTGSTLVDVLYKRAPSVAENVVRPPRQRLLRAFADVCRAVDFAHSRGVVHRDLKPSNIVLGDFGEVYVLDWGVARVLEDAKEVITADIDTIEGAAPAESSVGTPGYMAPEQLEGPRVDRAADIYSLGAILFEILAGEPLHARANPIASTQSPSTILSPSLRRPDRNVAPELDALCMAMLSRHPKQRGTARRCAERIEDYLDGDRDHGRRRTLATDLVWVARTALKAGQRADAMRAASRAIALDPEVDGAAELVTSLMLEPPKKPPAELREALARADAEDISRHAKAALPGYILIAAFLPIIIFNGVLDWPVVIAVFVSALAMAFAAYRLVLHPMRSFAWMVVYAIGNAAVLFLLSRLAGPFTFVPALVSFITASVITYPVFLERSWVLLVIMLGGFLLPFGLELGGVLESTWELRDNGVYLIGNAMDFGGFSAMVTVILASVATVAMAGIQSSVLGRAKRAAQHQLVAQAWHLRQLLPR